MNKKKAFTIVELVIVIAVIAILAAVLIPTFVNIINKANESKAYQEATNSIKSIVLSYDSLDLSNEEYKTILLVNGYKYKYLDKELVLIDNNDKIDFYSYNTIILNNNNLDIKSNTINKKIMTNLSKYTSYDYDDITSCGKIDNLIFFSSFYTSNVILTNNDISNEVIIFTKYNITYDEEIEPFIRSFTQFIDLRKENSLLNNDILSLNNIYYLYNNGELSKIEDIEKHYLSNAFTIEYIYKTSTPPFIYVSPHVYWNEIKILRKTDQQLYNIILKDNLGNILSSDYYIYGQTIIPTNVLNFKWIDDLGYDFIDWDKEFKTVTEDETYTANYKIEDSYDIKPSGTGDFISYNDLY